MKIKIIFEFIYTNSENKFWCNQGTQFRKLDCTEGQRRANYYHFIVAGGHMIGPVGHITCHGSNMTSSVGHITSPCGH